MKQIDEFIALDQPGHIAMSGAEITKYALREGVDLEECKAYFLGMSTVFPMMLLGHYYTWLTGRDAEDYMKRFVTKQKERYIAQTTALLDLIYSAPEDFDIWLAGLSSYMISYPYQILLEFAKFALSQDQTRLAEEFVIRDRAEHLPDCLKCAVACRDRKSCTEFLLWLGTIYPFELIRRFHVAVHEKNRNKRA